MSNEETGQQDRDSSEASSKPQREMIVSTREERYFRLIVEALQTCTRYKPMFGKGQKGGLTLEEFQQIYGTDPFYHWVGLDSPLVYAAHKAAGGMTSVYRQLGIGSERVFRAVLQDSLSLSTEQVRWSYQIPVAAEKTRTLTLDGRIRFEDIEDSAAKDRIRQWAESVADVLLLSEEMREHMRGAIFEVRQGYKSKDSKRQNADIANASSAYTHFYIPVLLLLSTQIDRDLALRYVQSRWLLLNGTISGNSTNSTYKFCQEVLDYDLAGFFESYSIAIKNELEKVLAALLEV